MSFFPLITEFNGWFRCAECRKFTKNPLEIEHSKNCTTPEKIKIFQKDGISDLLGRKNQLESDISLLEMKKETLKKEITALLQSRGVLEDDPIWIGDYVEALATL